MSTNCKLLSTHCHGSWGSNEWRRALGVEAGGGGGEVWGVGIGTRRWKKSRTLNQRKNFNKAPAKALFSLIPVFQYKWFLQGLKLKTYSQN